MRVPISPRCCLARLRRRGLSYITD
jgi:hypothetical protein